MNITLCILAFALVPLYFVCDARWQNIILLVLSTAFAWCILPLEAYIILAVLVFVYALGHIVSRKRSSVLGLVVCIALATILFILRLCQLG